MIVLDTNVLSEPMRAAGDPAVVAWLDRQRRESVYLTTITLSELLLGLELLPLGLRRSSLSARIAEVIDGFDARQILSFDVPAFPGPDRAGAGRGSRHRRRGRPDRGDRRRSWFHRGDTRYGTVRRGWGSDD